MKKIFFSQRFHDKTEEDIFEERDALKEYFKEILGVEVEIMDQYHVEPPKGSVETYNWAMDLLMLGEADLIVFCHDWEEALGCQMEIMIIPQIPLYGKVLRLLRDRGLS